jgi:hypothetical protein
MSQSALEKPLERAYTPPIMYETSHHTSLLNSYKNLSTEHKLQTDAFLLIGIALMIALFLGGGGDDGNDNPRPPNGYT